MRLLAAVLATLVLTGCGGNPNVFNSDPTSIDIAATPDRRQEVEGLAARHCAASGLVPRLTVTGAHQSYGWAQPVPSYHFDCVVRTAP